MFFVCLCFEVCEAFCSEFVCLIDQSSLSRVIYSACLFPKLLNDCFVDLARSLLSKLFYSSAQVCCSRSVLPAIGIRTFEFSSRLLKSRTSTIRLKMIGTCFAIMVMPWVEKVRDYSLVATGSALSISISSADASLMVQKLAATWTPQAISSDFCAH